MTEKQQHLQFILDGGVIAVIRAQSSAQLIDVVGAISAGGIKTIEITMTTPNAIEVIRESAQRFKGDVLIGVGTVLDAETARAAILAGAEYIVAPTLNREVIKLCNRYSKIVVPGTFTPTEILTAWELGADLIKVFPATVLGPKYFKDVKGPLPHIPMIPTGGVNLDNAGDFIKAGAVAIAVGSNLIDKQALAEGRLEVLTETARTYVNAVQAARTE